MWWARSTGVGGATHARSKCGLPRDKPHARASGKRPSGHCANVQIWTQPHDESMHTRASATWEHMHRPPLGTCLDHLASIHQSGLHRHMLRPTTLLKTTSLPRLRCKSTPTNEPCIYSHPWDGVARIRLAGFGNCHQERRMTRTHYLLNHASPRHADKCENSIAQGRFGCNFECAACADGALCAEGPTTSVDGGGSMRSTCDHAQAWT